MFSLEELEKLVRMWFYLILFSITFLGIIKLAIDFRISGRALMDILVDAGVLFIVAIINFVSFVKLVKEILKLVKGVKNENKT